VSSHSDSGTRAGEKKKKRPGESRQTIDLSGINSGRKAFRRESAGILWHNANFDDCLLVCAKTRRETIVTGASFAVRFSGARDLAKRFV